VSWWVRRGTFRLGLRVVRNTLTNYRHPDFVFSLKVPEDFTASSWPKHARYGTRAGEGNEHFLDARTFERFLTKRLDPYKERVGPLILEIGTFNKTTFPTPADFMATLDPFPKALPQGYRYAVEIRNREYLSPAYFDLLALHNVAHVFNAWTRMPTLDDQVQLPGVFTSDFTVVRALLAKGRTYERAVEAFEPYRLMQEPNDGARAGLREIAQRSIARKTPAFLYVNNRLEGFAPGTIEAAAYNIVMV
jgi:uncharacterized protein YecE (DUF72 family)